MFLKKIIMIKLKTFNSCKINKLIIQINYYKFKIKFNNCLIMILIIN